MKKLIILLTLFSINIHCLPIFDGLKNKFQNFTKSFDRVVTSPLGHENLSLKNEKFVRDIISELGMSQKINIKKLNFNDNACATKLFKEHIFIDEKFFDELTEDELRFVIGHELMHLHHNHINKKIFSNFVTQNLTFSSMASSYISRKLELEADASAAKKLNCTQGGISFFEKLSTKTKKKSWNQKLKSSHPDFEERIAALKKLEIK